MDSQTESSAVADAVAALKGIPTRDDLKHILEQNVVEVDFLKLNGDRRVMTCTLREDIKPRATKADPISQKAVRDVSDAVVSVWDINARGWRSFRYERVNSVKVVDDRNQSWFNSVDTNE
jgi:hypothetical protein